MTVSAAAMASENLTGIEYARSDYAKAVGVLISCRIIETGDAQDPAQILTRQDAALLLGKTLTEWRFKPEEYQSALEFADWPANPAVRGYIAYCIDHDIMKPKTNSTFAPNDPVAFQDYCGMLMAALNMPADNAMSTMIQLNWLDNTNWDDTQPLNRETAYIMLHKALFTASPGLSDNGQPLSLAAKSYYTNAMPDLFDVVYVPGSNNPKQRLDIYYPQGEAPAEGWPVLIVAHGGGFSRGDKFSNRLNSSSFKGLEHGYAIIPISYRLTGEAKAPAQILDTKAAIRFLRHNATQLGLNAEKFVAVGYSAGANLAALVATSNDDERFEPLLYDLGAVKTSDSVAAAIGFYGPYNYHSSYAQYAWLTGGNNPEYDIEYAAYQKQRAAFDKAFDLPYEFDPDWESPLFGKRLSQAQDLIDMVNPATYAKSTNAPLLLLHGEMDSTVVFLQSVELAAALAKADAPAELVLVPGAEHGTDFTEVYDIEDMFKWLEKTLQSE